jgi:hypothetical protein
MKCRETQCRPLKRLKIRAHLYGILYANRTTVNEAGNVHVQRSGVPCACVRPRGCYCGLARSPRRSPSSLYSTVA